MLIKQKIQEKISLYFYYHFMPHIKKMIVENDCRFSESITKKTKVLYTCLTGDYDSLPLHEYIAPDYDYICFTDNPSLLRFKYYGAWQIRPLFFSELDNQLNNRWHKTHPHILFPDYAESIYIDSNISILTDWLFTEVTKKNTDMAIPIHYKNDCIYDEIDYVMKTVVRQGKETAENVQKMKRFLQTEQFPEHYGLNENNVIYRWHNKEHIIAMMESWWKFIKDYTRRDQLSLAYVLWSYNIKPDDIAIHNIRFDKSNFFVFGHKK